MMMKAAFFDMDGTLKAYNEPVMSEEVRRDLAELRRRGVKVILATGRSRHDLKNFDMLCGVEFDAYLTFNGNCCYDDDGVYRNFCVPREDVEAACRVLRAHPEIHAVMQGENGNFINWVDDWTEEFLRFFTPDGRYPIREPEAAIGERIYQVVPFIPAGMEELFLPHMPGCMATRWHEKATDIIPKGDGKADGVRATLERYGLRPEEAIAFGDGENDMSMLAICGIGVAMGNAGQKVKDSADYVTLGVRENGVSHALRHFGLLD